MNSIGNHTWRSIRAHMGQPIVITITIIVVTFLLFASLSLKNVFYNFQVANLARIAGDADVRVSGDIFSGEKLDEFLRKSEQAEYVQKYLSMTGLLQGDDGASTVLTVEATDIRGFLRIHKDKLRYYDGIDANASYVYPGIMIGKALAEERGLRVGDALQIYLGFYGRYETFTVTYIFRDEGFFANSTVVSVLTDLSSVGDKGLYTDAYIKLTDGADRDAFIESLTEHMSNPELTIGRAVDYDYIDDLVENNEKLLTVALLFIIALVIFLLLGAYRIVAKNRAQEMTVFKATGATPAQILLILLGEVVAYGLVGGIVGVVAARFAMEIVVMNVIPTYRDAVVYSAWYYVVSVLLAVVISVLGALAPMVGLAKKSVRTLDSEGAKTVKKHPIVCVVSAAFTVAATLFIFFVKRYAEIAAGILIVACAFFIFSVAPYVVQLVSALFSQGRGSAYLAHAGVKKNAESISVVRMIAAVVLFAFVVVTLVDVIIDASRPYTLRFSSDYVVQSVGGSQDAEKAKETVAGTYGVEKVCLTYYETADWDILGKETDLYVYAVENAEDLALCYDLDGKEKADFDNTQNAAIVGYDVLNRLGKKQGDTIRLTLRGEEYAFQVVATEETKTSTDRVLYVKTRDLHFTPKNAILFVNTSGNVPQADLYADLRQKLEDKGFFILRFDKWAYAAGFGLNGLELLLRFLQVLVGIVGCIGIVNLTISMMSSRDREFCVYRATGLGNRGYDALMLCESLIISVSGGLLGVVLSALFSMPLVSFATLIDRYVGWHTPWEVFVISVVAVVTYAVVYFAVGRNSRNVRIRDSVRM